MQTILERYLKAGAFLSAVALIIFIVDRYTSFNVISLSEQIIVLFALILAVLAMTVVAVRKDARRARAEMDTLLDTAASEDTKAKRLCVMASAQIRCCLAEVKDADVLDSVCDRYELVRNSEELETMLLSSGLLQKNARLLELRQRLQAAEKAESESKRRYEELLKNYRLVRSSLRSEKLQQLFGLKEYPRKENLSSAHSCLSGVDPSVLQSSMQICKAWANI